MSFGPKFKKAVMDAGLAEKLVLHEFPHVTLNGELTEEEASALTGLLAEYDPENDPDVPNLTRVYKSDMFRKMTDEEYGKYKQIRAAFPERLGAVFDGATSILTTDEFFPMLYAAAVDAYGEDRANELLAPTE